MLLISKNILVLSPYFKKDVSALAGIKCVYQRLSLIILFFVFPLISSMAQEEDIERVRILAEKTFSENDIPLSIKYHRILKDLTHSPVQQSAVCLNLISLLVESGAHAEAEDEISNFEKSFAQIISTDPMTKAKLDYFKAIMLIEKGDLDAAIQKLKTIIEPYPFTDKDFNCRVMMSLSLASASKEDWDSSAKYAKKIESEGAGDSWNEAGKTLRIAFLTLSGTGTSAELKKPVGIETPLISDVLSSYSLGFKDEALSYYAKIEKDSLAKNPASVYGLWALALASSRNKDLVSTSMFLKDADKITKSQNLSGRFVLLSADIKSNAGETKEAIKIYEDFLSKHGGNPMNCEVRLKYASTLLRDGQNDRAIEEYTKILDREDSPFKLKAADSAAVALIDAKEYDKASEMIKKMLELDGSDAKTRAAILSADISFAKGNYQESAELYSAITAKFPEMKDLALFGEIRSFYMLGDFQKALSMMEDSIKTLSETRFIQELLFMQAMATKKTGKASKAIELFNEYNQKYPNSPFAPDSAFEVALILFEQGDYLKAAEKFSAVAEKYPDNELAQISMYKKIYSEVMEGKIQDAEKTAIATAGKWPKSKYAALSLLWLADSKRDSGKNDEAEKGYLRVKSEYSDHKEIAAEALLEAAKIAISSDDKLRGFSLLDELSEKFPDQNACSESYFFRGDILSASGDYDKAIPFFLKASMKRPDSALAVASYGRLGDCYFSLSTQGSNENFLKASEFYKQVIASKKSSIETREQAMFKLGKCEENLGDLGAALANYMELIYSFETDWNRGYKRDKLWVVKSAISAIKIYIEKGDQASLSKAENIYSRLITMGAESVRQMRENIDSAKEKSKK